MMDVHAETPSGSRTRSQSNASHRSGKSGSGSNRSGSNRSVRSAAHIAHPDPSGTTKMEESNDPTKRPEPTAPTIDLSFDSPDNKKPEKQPKAGNEPNAPFPLNPMDGSAMNASSSSAAGADAPMTSYP